MESILKSKRQSLGLSKQDISNKTNLAVRSIQAYETAYTCPPAKDILKIARAYELTDEEIIEWLKYIEWKCYEDKSNKKE